MSALRNAPISTDQLQYFRHVKRLADLVYTGPRWILSHNTTPAEWTKYSYTALANGFVRKYADPLCLLGVGFGANTKYLANDIDRGSPYHPCNDPKAFERFLATLTKIGLTNPVIVQSSWSGGIHVYYFFDRDFNTFRVASLCQVTLINAKFVIKNGILELFPDCKPFSDVKSGKKSNHKSLRLPLQPNGGGLLLDRKGNPLVCGANDNHETQLAAFLELAKASARGNNNDKIARQLDPVYVQFTGNPSKYQHIHDTGMSEGAKEWKADLETEMGIGWIHYSQTNDFIATFVEYGIVFLKLNNEKELFEWALDAITNANGYKQYCCHQHQIESRILDWIKPTLAKDFYLPYCDHPPRSSDRDTFIRKHKTSKSSPTSKAELYNRERVDAVATKLQQTVDAARIASTDLPSRISDWVDIIQATARQLFGSGFSRTTLYKAHYKYIWMQPIATQQAIDIVPVTSITPTNMVYLDKTRTEQAFDRPTLCVTDPSEKNLKPIGGEACHRASDVCSVNSSWRLPLANQADPDLDPDLDPKNISLDPDSALPNFASYPQSIQADLSPDPIQQFTAELTSKSDADREQSIESDPIDRDKSIQSILPIHSQSIPNPHPIDSDLKQEDPVPDPTDPDPTDRDKSIQSILPQSILMATLPNLIINPQSNPIEPSGVDLIGSAAPDRLLSIEPSLDSSHPVPDPTDRDKSIQSIHLVKNDRVQLGDIDDPEHQSTGVVCGIIGSRAMVKWDVSQKLQTYPIANLTIINPTPKKISEAQQIFLYEQKARYLAQLIPYRGCVVSTMDAQQVQRGVIIAVEGKKNVCVNWQDGSSGRYAIDELRCTHSPCVNNFIDKLIDGKLMV